MDRETILPEATADGAPTAVVPYPPYMRDTSPSWQDLRIAERLLKLRRDQSISQLDLARRAGISASLISQIEHRTITPSIETICRIADALKVKVGTFFINPPEALHLAKAGKGQVVRAADGSFSYEPLAHSPRGGRIQGYRVVLEPGADCELPQVTQSGQDFALLLSGAAIFLLENKRYTLETGDTICYNADLPQRWSNPYEQPSELVLVHLV